MENYQSINNNNWKSLNSTKPPLPMLLDLRDPINYGKFIPEELTYEYISGNKSIIIDLDLDDDEKGECESDCINYGTLFYDYKCISNLNNLRSCDPCRYKFYINIINFLIEVDKLDKKNLIKPRKKIKKKDYIPINPITMKQFSFTEIEIIMCKFEKFRNQTNKSFLKSATATWLSGLILPGKMGEYSTILSSVLSGIDILINLFSEDRYNQQIGALRGLGLFTGLSLPLGIVEDKIDSSSNLNPRKISSYTQKALRRYGDQLGGNAFDYIIDPISNKKVNLFSKEGSLILKNYIKSDRIYLNKYLLYYGNSRNSK